MTSRFILAIALAFALASVGCQKKSGPAKKTVVPPTVSIDDEKTVKTEEKTAAAPVKTVAPPPLTMPKVAMPAKELETCKLREGDVLPADGDLVGAKPLLQSLGPKFTVVLFWNGKNDAASLAVGDLGTWIAEHADLGVSAVAINVKDPVDEAKKAAGDAAYPQFFDPSGKYYAKIATGDQVPRVYLVDAQGKVLWFDIQYGQSTLDMLRDAIRAAKP